MTTTFPLGSACKHGGKLYPKEIHCFIHTKVSSWSVIIYYMSAVYFSIILWHLLA